MARPKKVVEVEPESESIGIGWHEPPVNADTMNEYANRVWAGQSVDLPKSERINRVKEALKGQGYIDADLQNLRIENA